MTVLLPYVVYFLWIFKIRGDIYYYFERIFSFLANDKN